MKSKNKKNSQNNDVVKIESASLKFFGAACPTCAYAIQHIGGKLAGVKDIEIDPIESVIHINYSGSNKVVSEVQNLVNKLGYRAEPM